MRSLSIFLAAAVLTLIPVAALAQGTESALNNTAAVGNSASTPSSSPSQPAVGPATATPDANYSIGSEDVLMIDVWKEPEISRTVPVRRDGKISLPLLNDVQAAGLTPSQLSTEIERRLRSDLVNPHVTVIVTQMSSQRIYILGQVIRGGAYPLVPDMTAVQALSIAGGFTPFANLKKIYVMRTVNGAEQIFPINYKAVMSGHKPQQNVQLKAGDTIVVP